MLEPGKLYILNGRNYLILSNDHDQVLVLSNGELFSISFLYFKKKLAEFTKNIEILESSNQGNT